VSDRALAERLVRVAGAIALELRGGAVERKGAATDVVTAADRRAEAALLELLRAERPEDGVLGEEGAAVDSAAGARRWLLDPVDGTLNYASGLPAWCSAVALVDAAGAAACAVYDPVADELFSAARGAGASRNGTPLAVAGPVPLADAVVATFVDTRRRDGAVALGTEALLRRVGALRAVGCGSLELAWIAAGRLHAWVQADVEPWDWHPGALLVTEAGGAATRTGRWHVAACAAALAAEVEGAVSPGDPSRNPHPDRLR
jgi:fructose-1,6-bisphosphatase/inositol monophosphatase family enzyme